MSKMKDKEILKLEEMNGVDFQKEEKLEIEFNGRDLIEIYEGK